MPVAVSYYRHTTSMKYLQLGNQDRHNCGGEIRDAGYKDREVEPIYLALRLQEVITSTSVSTLGLAN